MKKIIFTLSFLSSFLMANYVMAQACSGGPSGCTPTGGPFGGGFENPDSTPCVIKGIAYNHAIQFTMFSVFNYPPGSTQTVDSIEFSSIFNLPCGLCWAVNKANKRYVANEDGCINISGTTNEAAGQYKFALGLNAWINHGVSALPVTATLVDQAGIKIFIRVKTATGICLNVDTSSSANNLNASPPPCTVGINDLSDDFSSIHILPNPMNSNGILSFVSEETTLYTMRIADATGKVVSSKEIEAKQGMNSISIEKNNLPPGIYFLSLTDGRNSITNRFSVTE